MRSEFYREHGFIGNCDEGLTIPYVYTELVRKAEEGDKTSVFKMEAIVRHSDNEEVKAYIVGQLPRIYEKLAEMEARENGEVVEGESGSDESGDSGEDEEDPEQPENPENPVDPDQPENPENPDEPVVPFNPVASVNGVEYETLVDAVAAASDNDVITLTKDTVSSGVVFDKSVIVDLGGHTYTPDEPFVGSAGTVTNGFQLLKGNDITFQNGTITASGDGIKILVQNYANLTLSNVTIDGSNCPNLRYALSNNNGVVTLVGNTNIIAPEGAVAFDAYDYSKYYDGVTVNVNTSGTITGKIELDGDKEKRDEILAKINIAGGTFTVPIEEAWCASGYEPVDNGDGTYTVKIKSNGGSNDDIIYDGGTIAL